MCRKLILATTLIVTLAPAGAFAQVRLRPLPETGTGDYAAPLSSALGQEEAPAAAAPARGRNARNNTPAPAQAQPAQPTQMTMAGGTAPSLPPLRATKATAAERAMAERSDPVTRAAFWGVQLGLDPNDIEAALSLSRALRTLGRYDQAAEAAQGVTLAHPDNREALLEFARAKIEAGDAFYSIPALRQARTLAPRDWQAVSLLGVAYEQVERADDAWATYQEALALSPDNPAILSNMAMFQAQRGRIGEAEALLRRAAARPDATAKVRLNLAYVLGVQGKMAEAERLLREDLPPAQANSNLAYLRALNVAPAEASAVPGERAYPVRQGG